MKTKGKLQWFVSWYITCEGWQVMKGGFRDSWYKSKFLAEERRDELNAQDA